MKEYRLQDWLPTTRKEMDLRGWDYVDVILFSGDAYVDHPSFGAAVIGRTLEAEGLRVAIVPQPNWQDDLRDFKKLGIPRLFFGISAGAMDSMVNHYTANKRLRSDDAYTPNGRHGMRPDYPTIVYSRILKRLFPDTPIIVGGIEASMRRLTHYDYWQDKLLPGILADCPADLLIYGMGERPIIEIARRLQQGENIKQFDDIPQTASMQPLSNMPRVTEDEGNIVLASHEECLLHKRKQSENFKHIEEESNKYHAKRLWQSVGERAIMVNPPYPPMTETEIDASFDLPYTRMPHPKYKGKTIPAYEMIKFSVNLHRGAKQEGRLHFRQSSSFAPCIRYMFAEGPPKSLRYPLKSGISMICFTSLRMDSLEREAMNLTESSPGAHFGPSSQHHAQTLVLSLRRIQTNFRTNKQGERSEPANYPLFHIEPPGLYRGRYGRIGGFDKTNEFQIGTSTGFYAYSYDFVHRNLLYRNTPLHR